MTKKQSKLEKASKSLLELAPRIANKGCLVLFAGEPKLPAKLKNR